MTTLKNFINGEFVESVSSGIGFVGVDNPATGEEIAKVPLSTAADVAKAVEIAQAAFPAWSGLTIKQRAAIMFKFHSLVDQHSAELAELIKQENGKNIVEALADVAKGIIIHISQYFYFISFKNFIIFNAHC